MPAKHNRKIVLGAAADFSSKINKGIIVGNRVMDDIEAQIIANNYLEGAPFSWVSLIICYVKEDLHEVAVKRISKKYGDISTSAYWNHEDVKLFNDAGEDKLYELFVYITKLTLLKVADKYKLKNVNWLKESIKEPSI